jgi:hypothetical protein
MSVRIGNGKLSNEILDKLMKDKVSSTEIDLLLYLALRQDAFGNVDGVYYKDTYINLLVSKQSFYNAKDGLCDKGYILDKDVNADYFNFRILNNKFTNKADDKKGYLNINEDFLFSAEFKKLKANEKKLCLKLLQIYQMPSTQQYGLPVYPETIASWLGIKSKSMAIIYNYCENISQFFPNDRKDGKEGTLIQFLPKAFQVRTYQNKSIREHYLEHKIKHICRIYRVSYTIRDIKDLIILLAQYAKKGIGKLYSIICDVLIQKRSIEPRLINFLINLSDKEKKALASLANGNYIKALDRLGIPINIGFDLFTSPLPSVVGIDT